MNKKLKISILIGTRPEIIKMAPIIRACIHMQIPFLLIHSNQHYDENLDKIFFQELDLPLPNYNLEVGSASHAVQTANIMIPLEEILLKELPDVLLVQGDTNTVVAGALVASKLKIKVGHIEAGLRSYFREMPEELNRIVADHLSDFLFAPTENSIDNLKKEGVEGDKVYLTGNTVVDAVYQHKEISKSKSEILGRLGLSKDKYILLTAHRAENIDNLSKLKGILTGISKVIEKSGLVVIYPIHPRAKNQIIKNNLETPQGLELIDPLGYLDFLKLMSSARIILTDSGGIQEETCILNIPCITLRENTERPETIEIGSNVLAGSDPESILRAYENSINSDHSWKNPYGDGNSANMIIDILTKNFNE